MWCGEWGGFGMSSSEGSSEEEHDDDDAFEMEPLDSSVREMPASEPPAFDRSKRRGSVIVLGGKQSAVSVGAEVAATLKRMAAANESNDINQMQAALTAAGAVAAMAGPGDPTTVEVQMMAMKLASRLSSDESLRESGALRRSRPIREEIRRLWDLMEMESSRIAALRHPNGGGADEPGPEVTRDGYRQVHMRISRALCDPTEGVADERKAMALADKDWAGDISRFSGTAHIVVWLAAVREKFREASARAVSTYGFAALFKRYDADGSGELDEGEFEQAVRSDLGVDETTLSAKELKQLFAAVDRDGSGEVDADEFTAWLFNPDQSETKNLRNVKNKFRTASERMTSDLGWQVIFDRYDDDNSGELDVQEFTNAVRAECGLDEDAVSDEEIKELFGVIDVDQSGGIDASELTDLLEADLEQASITFSAFYSSIFELTEIWACDEDEDDPVEIEKNYVEFLRAVFKAAAVPRDHVKHFSDAELETLEVFDDKAKTRPNFELRDLNSVTMLVQADGTIDLTGDPFTDTGPNALHTHIELPGPEPEPEQKPRIKPGARLAKSKALLATDDAQNSNAAHSGSTELDEDRQGLSNCGEDAQRSRRGGTNRSDVLWGPLSPKVFALNEHGSELAPAAARRKGCWALPWQVRFAHKPRGGAGALGAKRGDPDLATLRKLNVRVTRSKLLEQYNQTAPASEIPVDDRRHALLRQPQHSVSSQEYWAARRALLIETGVRAATSAQVASSKAVRRQHQIAAVNGGTRHEARTNYGHRDVTAQHSRTSAAEAQSAATARLEKERIEKMVSPFSPKRHTLASEDYDELHEGSSLSQQRPKTAPVQNGVDAILARPNTAPAKPRSSVFSPRGPVMQKTPRQLQSARDLRTKAAASRSGIGSNSPAATCRRGLDPMDIARGQTRPTATPPSPLFLPLSPRKFDGFVGTKKTRTMGRRPDSVDGGRDSGRRCGGGVAPIIVPSASASPKQYSPQTPFSPQTPSGNYNPFHRELAAARDRF